MTAAVEIYETLNRGVNPAPFSLIIGRIILSTFNDQVRLHVQTVCM